ncbi:MAG: hypothetical protein QOC94_4503 [Actinoplanes sp.]|jgi:hypothetical protein|nr:hypothetical protein [Actinoplanes sp.]
MDPPILADGTDNFAGEGRPVNETRATTPAFPPGRYGHRRDGRRNRAVPIAVLALVIAASLLLTVRLYQRWGQTDYQAQIIGWTDVTPTSMTIRFTVTVPAGASTTCLLRARDYGGNEVGGREVTLTAAAGATAIAADELVSTTARASVGEVLRCRPTG